MQALPIIPISGLALCLLAPEQYYEAVIANDICTDTLVREPETNTDYVLLLSAMKTGGEAKEPAIRFEHPDDLEEMLWSPTHSASGVRGDSEVDFKVIA